MRSLDLPEWKFKQQIRGGTGDVLNSWLEKGQNAISSPKHLKNGQPNMLSTPDSANQATTSKFERAKEQKNEENY